MGKQDLSKMGAANVSIEDFEGEPCIYKRKASDVELNFYQFAAEALDGVNTPKLLSISGNNLVIEYIPHSITLDGLHANKSTFEQLAFIHNSKFQPQLPVKNHAWDSRSTDLAMSRLNLPEVTQDSIRAIQHLSFELFDFKGLISGDSNEGNWATRDNGELVLFDWERFGFGSPAIDLAPLVRGLGTSRDYESIVEKYVQYSSKLSQDKLQRHLILAKVWLVVEVTNILTHRGKSSTSMYLNWFRENTPSWLISMEKIL
ncbi:Phosphotransferase enzyme family protein [Vibrio crassostreae]|nr:Phosphotransferase enzyme family protein [Vibrio crassostreae]CAK3884182.1 Phosphotransferase enzyme family protein [Vibrio crassostreae]